MKKLIYSLFFLLMIGQVMAQVPNNGLVAYYPFNGNANDESGNNLNGTVVGATLTSDRTGLANNAYNFGGNAYISFGTNVPTKNLTNWTLAAWVRPSVLPQYAFAVSNGADANSSRTGIADGYSMGIAFAQAVNYAAIGSNFTALLSGVGIYSSSYVFNSTTIWRHIAMSCNANNVLSFYVDGVLVSSITIPTPKVPSRFAIGAHAYSNTATRFFRGDIDEVRVYNRGLEPCEINQLAGINNAPLATPVFTTTPPTSGCAGGVTNYSISAVPNAASYQWSLDGVAISGATGLTFSKSWVSGDAGNHTVSVVARNACSTSLTLSSNILITAPTQPSLITGPTAVCINTTTKYVISSGVAGTSYNWSLAGVPLTDFIGNFAYVNLATAGIQSLSVTPSLNGCTGLERSTNITVNAVPSTPVFSSVPPTSVCAGTSSAFAITAIPGAGYEWRIGNTVDATLNASASWSKVLSAGNNIVSVIATRDCSPYLPTVKSNPLVTSVNVVAGPPNLTGSISAVNGANYACLGIDKTYQIPAPAAGIYCEWTLVDNSNGNATILDQTGRTCTVNLPFQRSYTLRVRTYKLTESNVKCYGTGILSTNITVNQGPTTTAITGNLVGCQYTPGNVYTVSPIDPTSKYTWATDNGVVNGINSADNPKGYRAFVNFPDIFDPLVSALNYTMSVTATNLCGSALVQLNNVKVNNNFPVKPKIACVAAGCAQLKLETNIPNTGITWTVYNSNGTKTNYTTPTIANPGNSQISVTVSNGTSSDNVACKYSAWYRPCDGTTGPNAARMEAEEINLPVESNFLIYPNPSTGTVTIETKGQVGKAYVFNTFGQVVAEVDLRDNEFVYSVQLESKGLYTFKIKSAGETTGYKVVVQ